MQAYLVLNMIILIALSQIKYEYVVSFWGNDVMHVVEIIKGNKNMPLWYSHISHHDFDLAMLHCWYDI